MQRVSILKAARYLAIVACGGLLLASAVMARPAAPPPAPPPAAVMEVPTGQSSQRVELAPFRAAQAVTGSKPATAPGADIEPPTSAKAPAPIPSNTGSYDPGITAPQAVVGVEPSEPTLGFALATQVRSSPLRLEIPAAFVDARIRPTGVLANGEMEAPTDFWEVGWYRYGTRPGDAGKAVMAGHVDAWDGKAVFYWLRDLQPGDEITVHFGGGDEAVTYTVVELASYRPDEAPLDRIFGPSDKQELILITCNGEWRGYWGGGYSERLVVYAEVLDPVENETDNLGTEAGWDFTSHRGI